MKLYRIANWDDNFENNRTRELKEMEWIPVPNKHDGDAYRDLLSRDNGMALYGAWLLIVQVASKCGMCPSDWKAALACGNPAPSCGPRGTLLRKSTGMPHTADTIARQTGGDAILIGQAMSILTELGWLEVCEFEPSQTILSAEVAESRQLPAPSCGLLPTIPHPTDYGREGKGKEEKKEAAAEFQRQWSQLPEVFPRIKDWTGKRAKAFKARFSDAFWAANYLHALKKLSQSKFCRGENERGWKADVDFFLREDSVAKILEGKYDNRDTAGQTPEEKEPDWDWLGEMEEKHHGEQSA